MTIFIIHELHKLMRVISGHGMSWEGLGSAKHAIYPYLALTLVICDFLSLGNNESAAPYLRKVGRYQTNYVASEATHGPHQ